MVAPVENNPVLEDQLKKAWDDFAEKRKDQAAEYQILRRDYQYDAPVISVMLTNPVEETLLDNIRREFLQHLRDRLKNSELTIKSVMQENESKKVIYTSKDKFEHLAEKYPYLKELKERLGLDWDY